MEILADVSNQISTCVDNGFSGIKVLPEFRVSEIFWSGLVQRAWSKHVGCGVSAINFMYS